MRLEIRNGTIDCWTDHVRFEIRRSSDSREERTVLMPILRMHSPSECKPASNRCLRAESIYEEMDSFTVLARERRPSRRIVGNFLPSIRPPV